ncbi:MAG TPA: branched-chain amino acid ABC transporter permease [Actinomycetota bacterium]|nr:branched-chain amino acid ABC transporter permease [Actinomycetota bacterium]
MNGRDRWRLRGMIRPWLEARRPWSFIALYAAVLAFVLVLPHLPGWLVLPSFIEQAISSSALAKAALFVLFALGLNVVVGFAGLLDLGYVAFWAIGAYTAAILTGGADYTRALRAGAVTVADKPEWAAWMWLILLAAIGVSVVAGVILGSPTLRLRGDYLAIVTLGFGEIVRITANNLDSITLGPQGITSIPHPAIEAGPVSLEWGVLTDVKYYYLLLFFVVLWIVAISFLNRSRIGRAWVAIREDEVAAGAMGVPVVRMKLAAFAIGACTAGVGGVIYAEQVNFVNPPTFSVLQSILILSMVVIGGMGSIPGAILGAIAVTLLPEMFREFNEYRYFVFGVALVAVMAFRPQGLWPSRRRTLELRGGLAEDRLPDVARAGGPETG